MYASLRFHYELCVLDVSPDVLPPLYKELKRETGVKTS